MEYKPKQRDIVIIDFAPSKGYEIKKRRPALVMSKDNYNRSTNLVIVCPITSLSKERPFLVPI
ncbi:type II toxin-antitoxin system PemK/MazF family toxin, partial [Enterococcus faecalis]